MQTISNFPLFPLNIVVFPGEELNLHIFEPRYRALIRDAEREGFSFGIPSYVHQKLGYGTEVSLVRYRTSTKMAKWMSRQLPNVFLKYRIM